MCTKCSFYIVYNVDISSNCSTFAGTPLLESVGLHEPFVESLRDTIKRAIQQVKWTGCLYFVLCIALSHVYVLRWRVILHLQVTVSFLIPCVLGPHPNEGLCDRIWTTPRIDELRCEPVHQVSETQNTISSLPWTKECNFVSNTNMIFAVCIEL